MYDPDTERNKVPLWLNFINFIEDVRLPKLSTGLDQKYILIQVFSFKKLTPNYLNFEGASEGGREALESVSIRLFGDKYFPTYQQVR